MIIGIRVEAENIQTGVVKHCNSSYFTMVAKNSNNVSMQVPNLILSNYEDVRRFYNCIKMIDLKKDIDKHEIEFDYKTDAALAYLRKFNVKLEIKNI